MTHWRDLVDPQGGEGAYLPWKAVEPQVGISRTTAWRLQKSGEFPRPFLVSPGRVAYRQCEVEAWKASRDRSGGPRRRKPPQPLQDSAGPAMSCAGPDQSGIATEASPCRAIDPVAFRLQAPRGEPRPPGKRRRKRPSRRTQAACGRDDQLAFDF